MIKPLSTKHPSDVFTVGKNTKPKHQVGENVDKYRFSYFI